MNASVPILKAKTPVHKSIAHPRKADIIMLRFLISIGIILLLQFMYWYFNEAHVGHKVLYWILTIGFGYKMLQMVYEWYYFSSISVPKRPETTRNWTVDMLTTYVPGEPYDMIVETLTAMVNVRYPHTTYLCDEGNDPYLKEICNELGVIHVYRGKNKNGAKAGNINYTLNHYATGELCIIMDPDHVPVPEFIDRVLPYFENPEVGYVQCIQGYANHNENFIARGAAEQTYLFYGPMMMGMQRRGTVQAIGANCTFRREALDDIGGHATGLCEDMHTSMQLHAKKWKSVYVPELLTRGRVPASLSAFYQQQLKWSRGCFELLFEVYPKLFSKLNWKQRFHYLLTPLYFLYGVIGLIDLGVPIISLFSFHVPLFIELEEFIVRILPVLLCAILIRHYVQRYVLDQHEEGFHATGGILRVATWWVYLVGFIYSIIRVKVPYIPTPKEGESRNEWKLSLPNIVIIIISAIAITYGLQHDKTPFTWMMAGFAGVNIIILGTVVLAAQQKMVTAFLNNVKQETLALLDWYWSYFRYRLVYKLIRNTSFAIIIALLALSTSSLNFSNIHSTYLLPQQEQREEKQLGWVLETWQKQNNQELLLKYNNPVEKVSMQAFELNGWDENIITYSQQILQACAQDSILPFLHWRITDDELDWACRAWDAPLPEQQQYLLQELNKLFQSFEQPLILYVQLELQLPQQDQLCAKENMYQLIYELFKRGEAANLTLAWEFSNDLLNDFPGKQYADLVVLPIHKAPTLKSIRQINRRLNLPVLLTAPSGTELSEQQAFAEKLIQVKVPVIGILQHSNYTLIPRDITLPSTANTIINQQELLPAHLVNVKLPYTIHPALHYNVQQQHHQWQINGKPFYVKGITYNPRHHWRDGRWYPTRRTLEADFTRIQAMGANTLSWYESNHYDANVINVATQKDLKLIYNFWLDPKVDYYQDVKKRQAIKKKIIQRIRKYKDQSIIISWNLGSGTWSELEEHFHQPYLTEVRQAYTTFINELALTINELDPSRPIMAGIDGSRQVAGALHHYDTYAPAIDIWGISAYNSVQMCHIEELMHNKYAKRAYLFSEFGSKMNGAYFDAILKEGKRLEEPSSYEKARLYAQLWSNHIYKNNNKNLGGIAYCWR
ncbi:MAG: glycosyltransferase family 2 protein, partial [Saprospiraceae bacterium]